MYRVYQTFTKTAPAFVLPPNHAITNDLQELAAFADEQDAEKWCEEYNKKHPCKKRKIAVNEITNVLAHKTEQRILLSNGCNDYQQLLNEGWQIKQIAGNGTLSSCWLLLEKDH